MLNIKATIIQRLGTENADVKKPRDIVPTTTTSLTNYTHATDSTADEE